MTLEETLQRSTDSGTPYAQDEPSVLSLASRLVILRPGLVTEYSSATGSPTSFATRDLTAQLCHPSEPLNCGAQFSMAFIFMPRPSLSDVAGTTFLYSRSHPCSKVNTRFCKQLATPYPVPRTDVAMARQESWRLGILLSLPFVRSGFHALNV